MTVAIVGAGASGMAAAWLLRKEGVGVEIFEREAQPGGRIGSQRLGDRLIDFGGKNIGRRYALFRAFVADMGHHTFQPFGLNSSRVEDGKLITLDAERRWRSMAGFFSRCSPRDTLRFVRMVLAIKRDEENGYVGGPYFRRLEEKLADPRVGALFGDEFCRLILRPLLVRTNGAEPNEVSVGNLGSNIKMLLDSYEQLDHGTAPVIAEFSKQFTVHTRCEVESLLVDRGKVRGLRCRTPNGTEEREYDGVVLATPAPTSAGLVERDVPSAARALREIRYFPVMVVVAEYRRPIFREAVRALVFDAESPLSNAGAYGVEDLNVVRYTFSGAAARRRFERSTDPEEMLDFAESQLGAHIPVGKRDRVGYTDKFFPVGLCAFASRHAEVVHSIGAGLRTVAGLEITGDYLCGASIEACFRASQACVRRLREA